MGKSAILGLGGNLQSYIELVEEENLTTAFERQLPIVRTKLTSISEEKSGYAYAEGKWTIKELLQHIIDAERIFAYRALCFARGEQQSLPGWEENEYAAHAYAHGRSWESLTEEFFSVRRTTELLYASFTPEALTNIGIANNNKQSPESIGFAIIGHLTHHLRILQERYLK